MTRNTWLTIIIGVLVVTNGMLAFTMISKKHKGQHKREHRSSKHHRNEGPKDRIIKLLNFDEAQQNQFEATIKLHRSSINKKDIEIRAKKDELFKLLNTPNDSLKTLYLKDLGLLKAEIDKIHFNHFLEIKSICKEDQLDEFAELTAELSKLFSPKGPKPKH